MSKADYVRKQGQDRRHECHWPGCTVQAPPAMWGCKPHWFKLPKALRDRVWDAYVPGQERRLDPSAEYLAVAHDVQEWILANSHSDPRGFDGLAIGAIAEQLGLGGEVTGTEENG